MEIVNCDFCGSSNSQQIVAQEDIVHRSAKGIFILYRCTECSLIYQNPRLSPDELDSFYSTEYGFHLDQNIYLLKIRQVLKNIFSHPNLSIGAAIIFSLSPFRKRIINFIMPRRTNYAGHLAPCRFLDIGCGSGLSTHYWGYNTSLHDLQKRGFQVIGLEPSKKARDVAAKHGLQVVAGFSQLVKNYFDCIRINWSLEHVFSPSEVFANLHELLTENGKLIVGVPNYEGLLFKLFPNCVEVPVHNYYFTPNTLEAYFNKFRFKVLDHFTFSYPCMFTAASNYLKLNPLFKLSPVEAIYFQRILDRIDPYNMGNDMVYYCEKSR